MGDHTITLSLAEATTEQLRHALSRSENSRLSCERNGQVLHTWGERSAALRAELEKRHYGGREA